MRCKVKCYVPTIVKKTIFPSLRTEFMSRNYFYEKNQLE